MVSRVVLNDVLNQNLGGNCILSLQRYVNVCRVTIATEYMIDTTDAIRVTVSLDRTMASTLSECFTGHIVS